MPTMKRFMQLLLSSFGIMALVLAGCSTEEGTTTEEETVVEEETTVEETTEETVEDEEATEEVAE